MTSSYPEPDGAALGQHRPWHALVWALVSVGALSRLLPLLDIGGRLLRQFPTEDGYLSLQIARNMALGLGMSVSEGAIPTNGTQPFVTGLWSVAYWLVGSDKVAGVRVVLWMEFAIACLTAYMLYRVALRLFRAHEHGPLIARFAAAAHFAAPIEIMHSMNCLESGTYQLAVLTTTLVILPRRQPPGSWSLTDCATVGMMLGWCFWVRNDAAFLIAGVCLAHWLLGARERGLFARPLVEAIIIGSTTILVATPWLFYNVTTFGHLMPISGIAESHTAVFAQNLHLMPTKVVEHVLLFAPIPQSLESSPLVVGAMTLLVIGGTAVGTLRYRDSFLRSPVLIALAIYAALLFGYYGLFFGAPHFASRYLFPLSGFGAMLFAWGIRTAWDRVDSRLLQATATAGIIGIAGVESAMLFNGGKTHMHFQVVEWVDANVPAEAWVGAIQTGTLGYFHDRTYNLDGKVNPEALEAALNDATHQYVIDKDIEYLVDWAAITQWTKQPLIAEHFDVVVSDPERNLGALQRR